MLTEERKLLRDNVLLQAKAYLEEFHEFFPFGCIIMTDGEIKPYGAFGKDEHPEVSEVLNYLENGIRDGVQKKRYKAAAIAVDVLFTIPETNGKMDALEIRMDSLKDGSINIYIPYVYGDEGVEFIEMYSDSGSLNVFS